MAIRGRPTIDDDALLKEIASKLAKNPEQSRRSAIVQALPEYSEAAIRRLERKWRKGGAAYLQAAHEEPRERQSVSVSMAEFERKLARIQIPSHNLDKILRVSRQVQDMFEGGAMGRAIRQVQRLQRTIDKAFLPHQVRRLQAISRKLII